jgi:hypothetical protein
LGRSEAGTFIVLDPDLYAPHWSPLWVGRSELLHGNAYCWLV